ncbi:MULTISPECIES: DUF2290 domain-containing protein [Bradyrhizobium]|uniref:DUF2290 domain-containing protein n=1 Tax=Bradyrhizobium TaxID=374 RepID=UPI00155F3871|nr:MULTISPECIES: DUF2290 domain-containing protein [Bradyrhizobium]MDD1522113.1 hypothetical protein [Bradyrhizobium sp. WBAH30]MDD1541459.1 hypothetical protein [Bradyrhizobium sp. WBAH41]MDD1556917.1 hypothetical protein [Bradyrhizobium sp. WBAH23]MDD1564718.1 hypothetical protein [Bradyrhizobium sp. WBAH33]MDD1589729.1 hypothetical protein [Bradyrhizobium sp. WBAH42]
MDDREFASEIRAAWQIFKSLGLERLISSDWSLPVDEIFRDVALDSDATYDAIYRTGLSRSHYNILLFDYAYFQFSRDNDVTWRLAFFPNPWVSGSPNAVERVRQWEAQEDDGLIDHEEASNLIAEMPYIGAVPCIRFESAPAQYREMAHPSAHFHIGRHDQNRWPSTILLGPKAFAMIIAKMYYPDFWARKSRFHNAEVEACCDQTLLTAMGDARFVHDFSAVEQQSFHFGKNLR